MSWVGARARTYEAEQRRAPLGRPPRDRCARAAAMCNIRQQRTIRRNSPLRSTPRPPIHNLFTTQIHKPGEGFETYSANVRRRRAA